MKFNIILKQDKIRRAQPQLEATNTLIILWAMMLKLNSSNLLGWNILDMV